MSNDLPPTEDNSNEKPKTKTLNKQVLQTSESNQNLKVVSNKGSDERVEEIYSKFLSNNKKKLILILFINKNFVIKSLIKYKFILKNKSK